MGRRKERRLAAMAASRRVKLDLFAEPSDLGESSSQGKVGEDMDAKPEAPKSPSSSGQPANPLLLLGQYSDEDLEEESEGRHSEQDISAADKDEQGKHSGGKEIEHETVGTPEHLSPPKGTVHEPNLADTDADVHATSSDDFCKEVGSLKPNLARLSSWKMVLHEESNQYYYWNTDTGETSWEVPEALSQAAGFTGLEMLAEAKDITLMYGANMPNISVEAGAGIANEVPMSATMHKDGNGNEVTWSTQINEVDQNKLAIGFSGMSGLNQEPSADVNCSYQAAVASDGGSTFSGSEQMIHANQLDEVAINLPTRLVKQSELLLERLNTHRFENDVHQHSPGTNCSLELEIRLSDFKSLLPYGSSLQPFWLHSDIQVRRLEQAVDNILGMPVKSDEKNENKSITAQSLERQDITQDGLKQGSYDTKRGNAMVPLEYSHASPHEVVAYSGNIMEYRNTEYEDNAFAETNLRGGSHSNEDADMDVDMEVEDIEHTSDKVASEPEHNHIQYAQQFVQPSPLGEEFIPPPPEEEWIPPPPPDDEEIPPPPPDELPPDASLPPSAPSYPEPVQSFAYTVDNNLTYPTYNFTFYGGTPSEALSSSFYGHAEGYSTSVSNPQMYYGAVSNLQLGSTALMTNPVEPSVYHGLQETLVPTVSAVTTAEISSLTAVSDPLNYEAAVYAATVNSLPTVGTLPKPEGDSSVHGSQIEAAPHVVHVPGTVVSDSAAIFMEENASVPSSSTLVAPPVSTSGTSVVTAGTAAKDQFKVVRSKKRSNPTVSSLKSNKKVSSLVDKWKAVKEQIHDEEEEPEDALEILERKRQREIEEWRSKLLASGEAKENANFQPLGGDWRERVKRRRAQKMASEEKHSDIVASESSPPNLTNLSKDLPPGWQAYWDEASKQVYYGNPSTSETTWTRPK